MVLIRLALLLVTACGPEKSEEVDRLGNGVTVELVFIPKSEFNMGSALDEKGRNSDEGHPGLLRLDGVSRAKN